MKTIIAKADDRSSVYAGLDAMRMSEQERWYARASLRKGEVIAETLLRAAADMHSIAQGVRHVAVGMVSGIKALFAKPVKH